MPGTTLNQRPLSRFIRDRGSDAFEDIVREYAGLVHDSARRIVGDDHLAQDIAQAVFLVLLKKADKVDPRTLPGWLVKTARLVAREAIRSKLCRQKHETLLGQMDHQIKDAESEENPEQILPLLDEALSQLNALDRSAVVMRFLQGASFAAIGATIESSEEAARKRVGRALEKLRHILMSRGVMQSVGGLMVVMAAQQARAVPALSDAIVNGISHDGKGVSKALAKRVLSMLRWAKLRLVAAILGMIGIVAAGVLVWVVSMGRSAGQMGYAQRSVPATSPSTQTATRDLLQKFLHEYPSAAAKLEEAYSHVKIDSTEERTAGGKPLWTGRVELWRDGIALRARRNALQSNDPKWPAGSSDAFGTDGTTCFRVDRVPGDKDFTFDQYEPDRDFEMFFRPNGTPMYAAYCVNGEKLTDYLALEGVRILTVRDAKLDGVDVIELQTEQSSPEVPDRPDPGLIRGDFYFSPSTWALVRWTVSTPDKIPKNMTGKFQERTEYQPGTNPPKIKYDDNWMENVVSARYQGRKNEIINVQFGAIPIDEFKVTSVGVKNVPPNEIHDESSRPIPTR